MWQFISSYDRDYLIDYIESMASTRKPQRDETVGELLKLFCNKNSKRVREARLKLKVYYEHRSPAEWNSAQYRGRFSSTQSSNLISRKTLRCLPCGRHDTVSTSKIIVFWTQPQANLLMVSRTRSA